MTNLLLSRSQSFTKSKRASLAKDMVPILLLVLVASEQNRVRSYSEMKKQPSAEGTKGELTSVKAEPSAEETEKETTNVKDKPSAEETNRETKAETSAEETSRATTNVKAEPSAEETERETKSVKAKPSAERTKRETPSVKAEPRRIKHDINKRDASQRDRDRSSDGDDETDEEDEDHESNPKPDTYDEPKPPEPEAINPSEIRQVEHEETKTAEPSRTRSTQWDPTPPPDELVFKVTFNDSDIMDKMVARIVKKMDDYYKEDSTTTTGTTPGKLKPPEFHKVVVQEQNLTNITLNTPGKLKPPEFYKVVVQAENTRNVRPAATTSKNLKPSQLGKTVAEEQNLTDIAVATPENITPTELDNRIVEEQNFTNATDIISASLKPLESSTIRLSEPQKANSSESFMANSLEQSQASPSEHSHASSSEPSQASPSESLQVSPSEPLQTNSSEPLQASSSAPSTSNPSALGNSFGATTTIVQTVAHSNPIRFEASNAQDESRTASDSQQLMYNLSGKLPDVLEPQLKRTDDAELKLLETYAAGRNVSGGPLLDAYNSAKREERETLKLIIPEAGTLASSIVDVYKRLRRGEAWNHTKIDKRFKAFFQQPSNSLTEYETLKKDELESLDSFLSIPSSQETPPQKNAQSQLTPPQGNEQSQKISHQENEESLLTPPRGNEQSQKIPPQKSEHNHEIPPQANNQSQKSLSHRSQQRSAAELLDPESERKVRTGNASESALDMEKLEEAADEIDGVQVSSSRLAVSPAATTSSPNVGIRDDNRLLRVAILYSSVTELILITTVVVAYRTKLSKWFRRKHGTGPESEPLRPHNRHFDGEEETAQLRRIANKDSNEIESVVYGATQQNKKSPHEICVL